MKLCGGYRVRLPFGLSYFCIMFFAVNVVAQTNTFPSSGNVGIGTTSPSHPLDILGTGTTMSRIRSSDSHARLDLESSDSGGEYIFFKHEGETRFVINSTSSGLRFRPYGQDTSITFHHNGRMGILNTQPDASLEIGSSEDAGVPVLAVNNTYKNYSNDRDLNRPFVIRRISSDVESIATYVQDGQVHYHYRNDEDNGSIHYRIENTDTEAGGGVNANTTNVLTLRGDGQGPRVGINSTTPDYTLDVNGIARAKEIIVKTGWSDFVFKPDYPLMPLQEVQAFIPDQGHLPGIPSEKEVLEKGVSVGESQKLLLQKIEELTLYALEQQEALDRFEQKLNQKEDRIRDLEHRLRKVENEH